MQGNTAILFDRDAVSAADHAALAGLDAFEITRGDRPKTSAPAPRLQQELDDCQRRLAQTRSDYFAAAAALRCARSELRMTAAALMSSQEVERHRIAGELHDSIGQALGSVGFGIGGVLDRLRSGDTRAAEEMLTHLAEQTHCAIAEVRRIAMDLRPATLDHLGLIGTLSWFFREFRAVHPAIAVLTDIDVAETEVPRALTTVIYRVVQEACRNVVQHAAADEIRISFNRISGRMLLSIEDNGCGIAESPPACESCRGMGLRSMRNRVEFSGGAFVLESNAGAGTRISADWPIAGAYCQIGEAAELAKPAQLQP